jgi:hypothetical protein
MRGFRLNSLLPGRVAGELVDNSCSFPYAICANPFGRGSGDREEASLPKGGEAYCFHSSSPSTDADAQARMHHSLTRSSRVQSSHRREIPMYESRPEIQMKPFLLNFLVERSDPPANQALLYSDECDMSDLVSRMRPGDELVCLSHTQTRIRSEQPDVSSEANQVIFLASKTVTEVKTERPDAPALWTSNTFLSSSTFTKARGEGRDSW